MIRTDLVPGVSIYLGIPSAGRAKNVQRMQEMVGPATWHVPPREWGMYRKAGAFDLGIGGTPVAVPRNHILEISCSLGMPCLQLDDDLQGMEIITEAGVVPATINDVAQALWEALQITGAKLAGAPPTGNAFYGSFTQPIRTTSFIVGSAMMILPNPLRFDPHFKAKEDYDHTLQHLETYGTVARREDIVMRFQRRTNPGGLQSYRTNSIDQADTDGLLAKWPHDVVPHRKKEREVQIRWRGATVHPKWMPIGE